MSRIGAIYIALMMLFCSSGCKDDKKQLMKWQINLNRLDKRPYGTFLAYQSLKYYFPNDTIEALPEGFRYNDMDDIMKSNENGRSLLVLEGLDFQLSKNEWQALKEFINNGNEVVIFCSSLDKKIEEELMCHKEMSGIENRAFYQLAGKHTNRNVLSINGSPPELYGYEGRAINGYFSFKQDNDEAGSAINYSDIPYMDTLGYANSKPDFVRYVFGEGHISLHAAPLVLSNYFLLQPGNVNYLTALWQTLPKNINRIYWNDYFKRSSKSSGTWILWSYPATRLALLLGMITLLLYVLFEGKRKQRIIPVIQSLKNDSVSFAETVGRLYYNKGNHTNLAEKMTQQFLEWVRTHYFLNTNLLNDNFIYQLTIKSGQQEAKVRSLVEMIHEIKLGVASIDDAYLYQLYNSIQQFYNFK